MRKNILSAALLLLASAQAGRLDDVARRRGFHPDALKSLEKRGLGVGERAAEKRRYYNDDTAGMLPS